MITKHPNSYFKIALLATSLLLAACSDTPSTTGSVDQFFSDFTDEWVRQSPNQAIRYQYFQGDEQDLLSREMTPVTREWSEARISLAKDGLEQLASFDRESMSDNQQLSADIMQWQLQSLIDNEMFLDYNFPLQQMNGVNVGLINALAVVHPISTQRDAENYIARLRQVDERMKEAIAISELQATNGIIPPRFILERTISSMDQLISPAPADNPLVTALAAKMESVSEIEQSRRTQLVNEAIDIVETEVYPVYQSAIGTLAAQQAYATDDAGLWRFEDGAELYAKRLRAFTTTNLSAEEIHNIGLQEVARIEQQMDGLLREIGYDNGSIIERVEQLRAAVSYPDTDEGRTLIMSDIQEFLADALLRTGNSFDIRPEAEVIAQPYPEFRWASAAASYSGPPADGSRPGIFQMPLRASWLTQFGLRSLVYHETVPGHHFQIALSVENAELPTFRQIRALGGLSANSEGWGLYAERFAAEDNWYDDDVVGRLGQLNSELFRAKRLVVDTGLHAMRWTRQQAIDYGIEASEIERYVVMPGQACSYMIGLLKIIELRERARDEMGDSFSLREYHNLVLNLGVIPLEILEQRVDRFIADSIEAQ
jgi:uncharacterized protein (DUF885 family)